MVCIVESINDKLVVFSRDQCKFCIKSKTLLTDNSIPFTEIKLDPNTKDYEEQKELLKLKSKGHSTFPFIFIGSSFLGGFTELNHSLNTNISEKLGEIGIKYEPDLDF